MSRGKRFAILGKELNPEKESAKNEVSRKKVIKGSTLTIIDDSEFERNLKKHKLKEDIQAIEKKKIDIKIEVKRSRAQAFALIGLGLIFIYISLNKFYAWKYLNSEISGDTYYRYFSRNEMSAQNYGFLGFLILLGTFWFLKSKRGEK